MTLKVHPGINLFMAPVEELARIVNCTTALFARFPPIFYCGKYLIYKHRPMKNLKCNKLVKTTQDGTNSANSS